MQDSNANENCSAELGYVKTFYDKVVEPLETKGVEIPLSVKYFRPTLKQMLALSVLACRNLDHAGSAPGIQLLFSFI
ncbi:hypothetical protein ACET3Z_007601 [Daucus carota]